MEEPQSTSTSRSKRPRAAAAPLATPSPSRRRRRRLTGSSPGCVPRPMTTPGTATTPVMALRTPPRRLLPPSGAGNSGVNARTTRPRRATPVLRLDGDEEDAESKEQEEEEEEEVDGASTGDDAFSIISGDGSPERDRHVLDFLSFNSLGDGTPAFSLFTPSPAMTKTATTRHVKHELAGGAFTPQASPLRSRSSASSSLNTSPSRFFRSPFSKSRSNSTVSSPASLRLSSPLHVRTSDEDEETKRQDGDETMDDADPRRSVSPRTPQRRGDTSEKNEPLQDVISVVCRPPRGSPSLASTPSSSASNIEWRRNSLSLMRTPSPAASAQAKALRSKALAAQLLRSTTRDPFGSSDEEPDKEELGGAPSGAHDQDWFFSFANTLSPLAPGGAHDEDLETSFLSLKFSPVVPASSIDLQRLLPPFPSPGLGPSPPLITASIATPKTPLFSASSARSTAASSSPSSSSTAPSSTSSGDSAGNASTPSSSSSRELNESFPNIRASTSATPGRDERLKVSSSSVMKMKLHVTFDQYPPSHTKREIDAINNSLKRKKHARKRKLEESKQLRQGKTNGKGLNVQRKLLQTPVKEDSATKTKADQKQADAREVREQPSKNRKALQAFNGRPTQRRILAAFEELSDDARDDDRESVASSGSGASSAGSSSSEPKGSRGALSVDVGSSSVTTKESSAAALRKRLSPTFGGISTPTLPPRLVGSATTPNLHPLRLRKSPTAVKPPASRTEEKPAVIVQTQPPKDSKPIEPSKPVVVAATPGASTMKPTPQPPAPSGLLSRTATPPVRTPVVARQATTGITPLTGTKGGFLATPQLLATPVQQAAMKTPAPAITPPDAAAPKKKSPCNCKKSKCLKLYCECFASGGYCDESCNCVGCANTPANEPVRQQAIASRLEKNPNAFKPKIETTTLAAAASTMTPGTATTATAAGGFGFTTPHSHLHSHHHHSHPTSAQGQSGGDMKKMHKHGCHCKKSACQKRYCECFQAGVPCGDNCRCIDCKNQSPYVAKNLTMATPLSAIGMRGPGAKELVTAASATGANPERGDEQFVSPTFSSIRQRLRIDRETWARNFSSPFEVSPRRERERTERFRTQLKNSRASALLRSFNATGSAPAVSPGDTATPSSTAVVIKSEPGITVAATSALSFRVNTAASFTSPPGPTYSAVPGGLASRGLSPISDASRPPPAPTPMGKNASSGRTMKTSLPRNAHAMEALAIGRKTPGRVYVLPLFGEELPPVKMEVSAAIFHFLTNADIYNASLVNRLWSRVTMGETVWDHSNFRRAPRQLEAEAMEEADGDVVMQS